MKEEKKFESTRQQKNNSATHKPKEEVKKASVRHFSTEKSPEHHEQHPIVNQVKSKKKKTKKAHVT